MIDGRLCNKLLADFNLIIETKKVFAPASLDLLWQLEQKAVAF